MDQSFLFQALVFLAAGVIMVPVSRKLGLGSVLGYLLAGIFIGPAVLGFIGTQGEDIMHFAEFGVVMMLFMIGLELEPQLLWRLRRSIAGLGGMQVVVTSLVGAGIAWWLGLEWRAALAAGMIISLSSTAIVLQTMNEKGLMRTPVGQKSFAVLLFQDIAVIPMLALFPLLSHNVSGSNFSHSGVTIVKGLPGWAHALVVLATIGAIIFAGRFLIRPFFRMIAATRLREVFTASALLIVVGIDDTDRVESGTRHIPRGSGIGKQRIQTRAGERYRTLQGSPARPFLYCRRSNYQFSVGNAFPGYYYRTGIIADAGEGHRSIRAGQNDRNEPKPEPHFFTYIEPGWRVCLCADHFFHAGKHIYQKCGGDDDGNSSTEYGLYPTGYPV